mmetsp:Transcript_18865/g.28455  ORF Transcript_18865/g.28455 Transcript_18865/m.28455 type:complete len:362 (-) Transcript_18865:197-1282(-)|eukprot:CAMPEP_0197314510 /NCGR_PEP_ID=MMETSP0891-20130614/34306_1 /TAXON_ID=44058 ORGANISM="Aureoumbra lagunensis, Strain CCMP1510" /NCGR_SAMPLE_ID=MMETSP0891 /ASSEMBLY_ACC=CAM_ASM_000534 /LENGTH=361 /DNA_ID=CAMNT_0042802993 /DNA_START=16 /DNA_END=1101 /DNA_ORIENTATION=+
MSKRAAEEIQEGDNFINQQLLIRAEPSKILYCIISTKRASNVGFMNAKLREGGVAINDIVWIVGIGEFELYNSNCENGEKVVEGGDLTPSRNKALTIAIDNDYDFCVQLSDDLMWSMLLKLDPPLLENYLIADSREWEPLRNGAVIKNKKDLRKGERCANDLAKKTGVYVSLGAAARLATALLKKAKALAQEKKKNVYPRLAGAYVNGNTGTAAISTPLSSECFIVGDFIVIDTTAEPRFDEEMFLKEDYDFTCQHLYTYGCALRINKLICDFKHYTNQGGAVDVRGGNTKGTLNEKEQYNINMLLHKWPGVFQIKRKKPNEVDMKWQNRSIELGGTKNVERPPKPIIDFLQPPAKKRKTR